MHKNSYTHSLNLIVFGVLKGGVTIKKQNNIIIIGIILCLFLTISAVAATDNTTLNTNTNSTSDVTVNNATSINQDNNVLTLASTDNEVSTVDYKQLSQTNESILGAGSDPQPTVSINSTYNGGITSTTGQPVFLNQSFAFDLNFNVVNGSATGWSPAIELYLPNDITITDASYLGYNVNLEKIGTFNSNGAGVTDPFNKNPISDTKYANYTLYVLSYPLGSFTTGTSDAVMNIKAFLSGNATVGDIQKIYATPLFKYKEDTQEFERLTPVYGTQVTGYVDPTVMTVDKNTTVHDWETATGPNYPYPYHLDVDIADGKTVYNVTLNDTIPNQLKFLNISSIIINGTNYTSDEFASKGITITYPDSKYTGGTLIVKFDNLTGTNSSVDARVWFNVYAPEFDNNTIKGTNLTIINKDTGDANVTVNNVTCVGTYNGKNITDKSNITVTLRSLAIQKGVDGHGWGSEIGLNTNLNYTANFQVSDYFDIGNMTITDVFGTILDDGSAQVFNASQPVTLTITVQGNNYTYTLTQENGGYTLINNTNGTQDVIFNIGKILSNNTIHNITNLTGGLYDSRSNNVGYAIGTLKFGISIGTRYTNSSKIIDGTDTNTAINGGDSVNNRVYINGTLANDNHLVSDTGGTHLVISTPSINKTVYAVNNNTNYKNNATEYNTTNGDVLAHSGDTITYMLNFTIPTGTEKGLNITDYLPIPFYNVTQFVSVVGTGTNSTTGDVPAAGHWAYGNGTNFLKNNESVVINPTFKYNDTTNYIEWMFGDTYSNAESHTVILLYTVTVTDAIIPDSIYKTNRATLAYDTTSLDYNTNQTISMVFTQFPDLNINKTVNTTSSVMNGTNVTYTVIVNNTGHGAAFNVTVVDNFNNLNISNNQSVIDSLKVVYSNGTSITLSDDDKKAFFNGTGLLIKELASQSYLNISYEVVFNENLVPNTEYVNTANITSYYAGTGENATNFVNNTNDTKYFDTANVTATSFNFTKTYAGSNDTANSLKNLTIGETGIWYLNVTLPQNLNVTNLSIIDTLPTGFMYTNLTVNTTSNSQELKDFLSKYTITNSSGKVNITFTEPIYSTSAGENFTIILYSVVTQNSSSTYYKNNNHTTVTNVGKLYWADATSNHTKNSTASVTVIQPILSVNKTFNPTVLKNDYSNATIVIKNIGSTTAFNVTVFDNMTGDAADFNETDWNATVYYPNGTTTIVSINKGVLSFDAGNLTPGQNITIKYNMTLDNFAFLEGSIYNNTVSVNYSSMNDTYPYRANYTTNASALLNTDLVNITKTLTNTSFTTTSGSNLVIGETGTFNITFVLARGEYQNLTLSDNLPAGMVLVPGSIQIICTNSNFNGDLGNITTIATNNSSFKILLYSNSTNNITQSLIMDNNVTVIYNATLTNASTNKNGTILRNTANIEWGVIPKGHNANTTVTVVEPNLGINKTANMTNLNIGDNFTYNITVFHTTASKANATNVTIKDTLPNGIYFTNITNYTTINGVNVNFTDNKTVIISMSELDLGKTQSIILQTGVENNISLAGINITNIANVTYVDYTGNRTYNATNNTKVHILNVDLVITKTNSTNVVAGQNVTYTITIKNNGPDNAYNVTVKDLLPDLLQNVTYTYGGKTTNVGTVATIYVGEIDNGKSVTITVTGFIPADTIVSNITNTANVTTTTTENITTNNNVSVTNNITKNVDIQVTKTVNNTKPNYMDNVTYTIVVKNNGPDTALNVTLNELLPENLTYVSDNTNGAYDHTTGVWNIGTLTNGSTATLTIKVTVNGKGSIVNNVNATTSSNDTNISNNNDTVTITVVEPNLGINKTANMTNLNIGDNFTYNITVFHTSTSKANATNVTINDTLPDGIYFTNTTGYTNGNVTVKFIDNKTVTITITRLNLGNVESIILQTGVENNISLADANITNVVNLTYFDPNGQTSYNATNNTKVHVNNVDLVITKTNTTSVIADENVSYNITVTNNGPDTAYDVVVDDVLPTLLENVTYTLNGKNYTVAGAIATINVGTLNKGQTVTITVTGFIPANTTVSNISNFANVTTATTENVTTNNNVTVTNYVTKDVDIQVNKTVNNTNPAYNDYITYTIVVKNNGPDEALNVTVNEVLPNGLILKSYNTTMGNFDKTTGIWSVGTLGNNTTETLTIIAFVNKTGNFTNTVNTTTSSNDTNTSNNNATVNITVNQTADLSINKIASISTIYPGNQFTYTITVTNNGPDNATGVKVNDVLPNGVSFVSTNSTNYNKDNGVWTIGALASGNSTSLTITVTAVNIGAITNVADVTGNQNETTYNNNHASVTINVISTDLFINKTVSNANPEMGDTITYTIVVGNNGPYDATGVKATEILPNGLIYISDDSNGAYNSTSGIWNIGNLANGQKVTLNITVLVNKTGNIINIVNVTGNEPETSTSNNNFTANITVPPMSDLSVTKVANITNTTKYGSNSSYTITVTNLGVDNATGVKVNDNLPAGIVYVSDDSNGAYNSTTGIWTIGNLGVGQTVTLTIYVKINTTGNITNFADVNGTNYDPNMSNNHANVTVDIPAYVDLSINETVSNPTPKVGDVVVWTVSIRNNGPDNDTGVIVHDLMPNIKFLKAAVNKGYYNETADEWYIGDFNVGETATLVLTTQVTSTGTFTLPTTVVGNDNETTYSNNNATASIVVTNDTNGTNGTNHTNNTPTHPVGPNGPHYPVGPNPISPNHPGLTPNGPNHNGVTANVSGNLTGTNGSNGSSNGVSMAKTGNPILALLLILSILVGIRPFRKNRK